MRLPNLIILDFILKARYGANVPAGFLCFAGGDPVTIGIRYTRRLEKPAPAVGAALRDIALLYAAHQLHIYKVENIQPNIFSRKIRGNRQELTRLGISFEPSRDRKKRTFLLQYDPVCDDVTVSSRRGTTSSRNPESIANTGESA